MRIPSGKIDQVLYFVAVDSTDLKTRKTGLSAFTVYRSRNGGTATIYTTPTIVELSAANMPGVYSLLIDEDTTIASSSDAEEMALHITCATMAAVTRVVELFRRDTTSGQTIAVAGGNAAANLIQIASAAVATGTAQLGVNVVNAAGTAWNSGAIGATTFAAGALTATKFAANALDAVWSTVARTLTADPGLGAAGTRAAVGLASANLDTQLSGISSKTTNLPPDPADASDIAAATASILVQGGQIKAKTDLISTSPATDLLDLTDGVETGLTVRSALRLISAALFGKVNGAETNEIHFRDYNDTKDRIDAATDSYGNRTVIFRDPT